MNQPLLSVPPERAMRRSVYLYPGRVYASRTPTRVTTLLGSCVAVTLWDRRRWLGGINHFLLPFRLDGHQATPRVAGAAMTALLTQVLSLGATRRDLHARVFGGACVLSAFRGQRDHLGQQNVRAALDFLQNAHIPIMEEDCGGHHGRKLIFDTAEGIAVVKYVEGHDHGV